MLFLRAVHTQPCFNAKNAPLPTNALYNKSFAGALLLGKGVSPFLLFKDKTTDRQSLSVVLELLTGFEPVTSSFRRILCFFCGLCIHSPVFMQKMLLFPQMLCITNHLQEPSCLVRACHRFLRLKTKPPIDKAYRWFCLGGLKCVK